MQDRRYDTPPWPSAALPPVMRVQDRRQGLLLLLLVLLVPLGTVALVVPDCSGPGAPCSERRGGGADRQVHGAPRALHTLRVVHRGRQRSGPGAMHVEAGYCDAAAGHRATALRTENAAQILKAPGDRPPMSFTTGTGDVDAAAGPSGGQEGAGLVRGADPPPAPCLVSCI